MYWSCALWGVLSKSSLSCFPENMTTAGSSQPHRGPVVRIQPISGPHFNCKASKFLRSIWSPLFNIKKPVPSSPTLIFSFINSCIFVMLIFKIPTVWEHLAFSLLKRS